MGFLDYLMQVGQGGNIIPENRLLGKKGKRITDIGVILGSLLPYKTGVPISTSLEALRQTLYPSAEEHGLGGLKKTAKAGVQTATARTIGKGITAVLKPLASLSKIPEKAISRNTKPTTLSELNELIRKNVGGDLEKILGRTKESRGVLNRVLGQTSSFGTAPAGDITERVIPLKTINELRKAIGPFAKFTGEAPATAQTVGDQALYRTLSELVKSKSLTARATFPVTSTLGQLGEFAANAPFGVGKFASLGQPIARNIAGGLAGPAVAGLQRATNTSPLNLLGGGQQQQQQQIPTTTSRQGIVGGEGQVGQQQLGQQQTTQQKEILSPKGQWKWDAQANDWIPNKKQGISGAGGVSGVSSSVTNRENMANVLQELMVADLFYNKGKNVSEIKSVLDVLTEQAKSPTATVQDRIASLGSAGLALDRIESLPQVGLGPEAGIPSQLSLKYLGGKGVPTKVTELGTEYEILRQNIVRSFNGARMSDQDIKIAERFIPTLRDTEQTARAKIQTLRVVLNDIQSFLETNPNYNAQKDGSLLTQYGFGTSIK